MHDYKSWTIIFAKKIEYFKSLISILKLKKQRLREESELFKNKKLISNNNWLATLRHYNLNNKSSIDEWNFQLKSN